MDKNQTKRLVTKVEEVTVGDLEEKFGDNIELVENFVKSLVPPHVDRPRKPKLSDKNYNSVDAKKHAADMEKWEADLTEYGGYMAFRSVEMDKADDLIEKYTHENLQLDKHVPARYKEKVVSKAHSGGMGEGAYGYYHNLRNLIEIFKED